MKKNTILAFILLTISVLSNAQKVSSNKLNISSLKKIGTVDQRFQSYNIEMCEVIGGDFWVPYEKMDSVKKFSGKTGFAALKWKIDPINLYEPKLRNLARALGPAYVRVSGTWANDTYFQNNDNKKLDKAPTGFNNILTRAQWKGVVDYCKAVDGKIVGSFAISDGMHNADGTYNVEQVKDLIEYTKSIGGEFTAAEMFNEPTFASHGSAPKGYNAQNYANDFAVFNDFVTRYYPEMMVIGPGSVAEGGVLNTGGEIKMDIATEDIMQKLPKNAFKAYAYHYYGGVSIRCGGAQTAESVLTNEWLSKTEKGLAFYKESRDKYTPGAPIWLNETAEAACGGDPLASTFVDTFRYLEQLGRLAKNGVQSVMHNTLARSEYGLLDQTTHDPRPNYWVAFLWAKLMGSDVYDAGNLNEGVDVFAHNLKGTKTGKTMLVLNTNAKETTIQIPKNGIKYLLTADELLSKSIKLNGKVLKLTADDNVPELKGEKVNAGTMKLPARSIAFLSFQ
jgi:heparanase